MDFEEAVLVLVVVIESLAGPEQIFFERSGHLLQQTHRGAAAREFPSPAHERRELVE